MNLQAVLIEGRSGLALSGRSVRGSGAMPARSLKYLSVGPETLRTIENNRIWAETGAGTPQFQFVFMMLPTPCNQRCSGCFTGKDKSRLPSELDGPYFEPDEYDAIFETVKAHGACAVVYSGDGELFSSRHAFTFIESVIRNELGLVIFTNGSLLTREQVARINSLGGVLIVSLRDTVESFHNEKVGRPFFRRTIQTIEYCLDQGMHDDGRLAIEMPVTRDNEDRVLNDLLPICRALGIVPWIEEFILTGASPAERDICHGFTEVRRFFEKAATVDKRLGYPWMPVFGQRLIGGNPLCERPRYSCVIYPSGDVMSCPTRGFWYGNSRQTPLSEIIRSERFRQGQLAFRYCPCSRFYTGNNRQIPIDLPEYLKEEEGEA